MRSAVLGIGSNLGDSLMTLEGAVSDLQATEGIEVTAASPVYETDPVGGPDQGVFVNAVLLIRTTLDGHELLAATQAVEQHWHRVRDVRWGPRTLDIDIVAIGNEQSDDPVLTLPHPLASERAFVLVPWLAVDPDAEIVGRGRVQDLLERLDAAGVRLTSHQLLVGQAPLR